MTPSPHRLACLGLFALVSACALPGGAMGTHPQVQPVHQQVHSQCPWNTQGPAAALIGTEAAWQAFAGGEPARALERPVDWAAQRVVLYASPTRPSLGWGLALAPEGLSVRGDTLAMTVRTIAPDPGRMQGAALTRPCLMVVVPRGAWRQVEVRDAEGGRVMAKTGGG